MRRISIENKIVSYMKNNTFSKFKLALLIIVVGCEISYAGAEQAYIPVFNQNDDSYSFAVEINETKYPIEKSLGLYSNWTTNINPNKGSSEALFLEYGRAVVEKKFDVIKGYYAFKDEKNVSKAIAQIANFHFRDAKSLMLESKWEAGKFKYLNGKVIKNDGRIKEISLGFKLESEVIYRADMLSDKNIMIAFLDIIAVNRHLHRDIIKSRANLDFSIGLFPKSKNKVRIHFNGQEFPFGNQWLKTDDMIKSCKNKQLIGVVTGLGDSVTNDEFIEAWDQKKIDQFLKDPDLVDGHRMVMSTDELKVFFEMDLGSAFVYYYITKDSQDIKTITIINKDNRYVADGVSPNSKRFFNSNLIIDAILNQVMKVSIKKLRL